MSEPRADPPYRIEPKNKFFIANLNIVEYELRPGNTVTFLSEVDLTEVEQIRLAMGDARPSYTAFVAKAVALALRDFPYANRRVIRRWWWPFARRMQKFNRLDVAIAVERDIEGAEGVAFVDVLRDADTKSLTEMTAWMRTLASSDVDTNKQWRTYSQLVTRFPSWLTKWIIRIPLFDAKLWAEHRGGAVLISSPAKYGVDSVIATWSWPLGISFGLVKPRVVVRDGAAVARTTFNLTLNFDRRVMAGAQAGRFFKRIVDVLESAQNEMREFYAEPAVAVAPALSHV